MPLGHMCTRCGFIHFAGDKICPDKRGNARRNAKPQKRVYANKRWPGIRRFVAARADYICEICNRETPLNAGICDHKHGFRDERDPRAFNTDLMQWLCKRCSGKKDAQAVYR